MARLYQTGFELQSLSIELEAVFGGAAVSTSIFRSGAASMRCNPTANKDYASVELDIAPSTTKKFGRAYIYIASATDTLTDILTIDSAAAAVARIRLATDNTLELWNLTTKVGSSSAALSTATWYRVELVYDDSIADNTVWGYVDGTQFATGTGSDSVTGTNIIKFGLIETCTADAYFDDVALNDTTAGGDQTGLPGEGKIVHLRSDSAGDNAMGARGGTDSGSDFGQVDEVTPNDITDYYVLDANNDILDVGITSAASEGIGSSDSITVVAVGIRYRGATASTYSFNTRVKSQASGTVFSSPTRISNLATFNTNGPGVSPMYLATSYTDPQAAGAWTPALLDTSQIGVQAVDAAPDLWVSTLWLCVEYVAAAAVTAHDSERRLVQGVG